jgi:Ser/Thr protein kinase RdoA (MazF antagonist)
MSDAKEYSVDLGSFYPSAVVDALKAENAKLRDALAHMLAFARRNWPEGVPDFEEQAVVIHAEAVMKSRAGGRS